MALRSRSLRPPRHGIESLSRQREEMAKLGDIMQARWSRRWFRILRSVHVAYARRSVSLSHSRLRPAICETGTAVSGAPLVDNLRRLLASDSYHHESEAVARKLTLGWETSSLQCCINCVLRDHLGMDAYTGNGIICGVEQLHEHVPLPTIPEENNYGSQSVKVTPKVFYPWSVIR
jgi:hypothetical protein